MRASQKQARAQAIQAAARRLFLAEGVEATTMDEVAEAAGVSRATLFNYYPGKAALLAGLSADLEQRLVDALTHYRNKHAAAPDVLAGLYAHTERVLAQTAGLTRLLLMGQVKSQVKGQSGAGGFPALRAGFGELAHAGQASGAWRSDVSAERLGETLYLDFLGSLLGWCHGADSLAARCDDLNRLLSA